MSLNSLQDQGLTPAGTVHYNLVAPELIGHAARRAEGEFADMGPFVAVTSPHTGRSPNDKFVVEDPSSSKDVDWGKVNQKYSEEKFDLLLKDVREYLNSRDELFVQDLFCGADPAYQLSVRYVSPNAWHMAFVRNMFIRPDKSQLSALEPHLADDPHRRHTLRRRAQEIDVHGDELHAPQAGRTLDALLCQHRQARRY